MLAFLTGSLAQSQTGQAPIILNSSETANAGDVIYLQGSGFGDFPVVQFSYNDSSWQSVSVLNSGNGYVSVTIPLTETRLPDLLTVRVSADSSNWSKPVYMNRARGISTDSDQIAAGGTLRIFGRNLYLGATPHVRFVDQSDNSSSVASVSVFHSSSYLLALTAPSSVVAGHTYSIYVSNGYSGNATSGGETLVEETVMGRNGGMDYWSLGVPWAPDLTSYQNPYNVQTDSRLSAHASGNGEDDTAALVAAVQAAGKAGGGVVYLPAGAYKLLFSSGCGLTLPSNVVLMGAGQNRTIVYYGYGSAPQASQGGYAVCFGNQTGISDLTLFNVNESGQWPQSGTSVGSQEVFVQRVTWNIGTSQWIALQNAHKATIQNSTLIQGLDSAYQMGPLALLGCSRCDVTSNIIEFAVGGMLFDSTSDFIFENNVVTRDISVSPAPQSVTHSIEANFATNFTVLNNTFRSQGNSLATNNDGEVISTEGGGPSRIDEFRGTVTASDSLDLTDGNQNFQQSSNTVAALRAGLAKVAVVSGNGMGQVRSVMAVSADGKTLTVDHPWDVAVDAGSNYATFDWSASSWIIAGNTMTGNFKGIDIFDASASDVLIQSNTLMDSDGIMVSPSQQPPGLFNVVRGLSIIDNSISDLAGLRPAYIGIIPREDSQTTSFGTAVLGATLRGNTVIGYTPNVFVNKPSWDDYKVISEGYLNYWFWQSTSAYSPANAPPPIIGTIFQSNQAQNSKSAFVLNTGAVETVIQDFVPLNVGQIVMDQLITGSVEASQGTILQGAVSFIPIQQSGKPPQAIVTHPISASK